MKRLLLVLVAMFVVAGAAFALDGTGKITVTVNAQASVAVSTDSVYNSLSPTPTIDFGWAQTGVTCISGKAFYVWNTSASGSSAVQKYTLAAAIANTGGTGWTLGTTWDGTSTGASIDKMVEAVMFKTVAPTVYDATCIVPGTAQAWDATHFQLSGDYALTHGNTTAGTPTSRLLWPAIMTPSASSTGTGATHTVTFTLVASLAG